MREILKNIIIIFTFLVILFLLFSVNQGTFDIMLWAKESRESYSVIGGAGSVMIIIIRWVIT